MSRTFPALITAKYQRYLEGFQTAHSDSAWLSNLLDNNPKYPLFAEHLQLLWGCSDFVGQQCQLHPIEFQELVESGDLQRSYSPEDYQRRIEHRLPSDCSEEQLCEQLRLFRRRELIRIIWRDFSRQAPLLETTADMTALAESAINVSLSVLHRITCEELGTPCREGAKGTEGAEQHMIVVAMGKMGAQELNISSDIDLIFAYPRKGETRRSASSPRQKTVSNQEFITRLGQKLIAALDSKTVDGFVFRVDMRLRPYGQSGALVLSFDALEEYYQTQGREWERYAMVKARAVAGVQSDRDYLDTILRPFTYRKYLDFGAIEALRDLKRTIDRELQRKGMQADIKLGPGGIREVEFITQAFQLIRGGRNSDLQTQSLYKALQQLSADQVLDPGDINGLWQAYIFLRNTEHALQGIADKQTQELPGDELGQLRVATILGFDNWQDFDHSLQQQRQHVKKIFADIFADPEKADSGDAADVSAGEDNENWLLQLDATELQSRLESLGYIEAQDIARQLTCLLQSKAVLALDAEPRNRLDRLMPRLVAVCATASNNSITLGRVLGLVQAVLRRSAYLALLGENPKALQQLVLLCERSSWVADQLTAYPALLDELLDPRALYTAPDKALLKDHLRQHMLRVPDDDLEQQMDVIRYFVRSYTLRVAACELTDVMSLMQVSDYLTWLAEVVIEHTVNISWKHMTDQYGQPQGADGKVPGFIVVGYGKVGGIELGYKSDLDLVFLYNGSAAQNSLVKSSPGKTCTTGPRVIDNSTFFARLGQRIIHILSTATPSGTAYEIDMRLRPSGNSGMLVSSLAAFEKYQREDAWTWEHQALVRARVVAGDKKVAQAFDITRKSILEQYRCAQSLRTEVVEMRTKMRKHLGRATKDGKFSLKQGIGGIVDIEFMVQFAVLAWSHNHPELTRWSDNIRILESLAQSELLSEQQTSQLITVYKRYRSAGHLLQLQNQLPEVADNELVECREIVTDQWQQLFENQ
jgi:[glutamine synthetase] adenylyltransferase / [glutamine synthetase]-adenylyl-L-tyrosine phosphorylase